MISNPVSRLLYINVLVIISSACAQVCSLKSYFCVCLFILQCFSHRIVEKTTRSVGTRSSILNREQHAGPLKMLNECRMRMVSSRRMSEAEKHICSFAPHSPEH